MKSNIERLHLPTESVDYRMIMRSENECGLNDIYAICQIEVYALVFQTITLIKLCTMAPDELLEVRTELYSFFRATNLNEE